MPRNGSGSYAAPTNSWNPSVNGASATAADWQTMLNDIVSALSQSVSKDGQTAMTNNLPMGGFKLTNLAAGSATGDSLRWQQLFSQGSETDVASAATVDIGVQNTNFLRITGTTTITSFGTNYNGPRFLRFAGVLTLTHSANLVLPGAANITTAAGDCCIVIPTGSVWQLVAYQRASGLPAYNGDSATFATVTATTVNSTNAALTTVTGVNSITRATRSDVASSSTVNLTSVVDDINITGTTTITAFTIAVGRIIRVRFNASLTLTNNASIVTQTGANIVTQAGDTCILRATAANTVEVLSYARVAQLTLGTPVSTTSGTAIDFTGIPSWAKEITVMLNGVSTNGTSNLMLQPGVAGSPTTSGYSGCTSNYNAATGFTTGLGLTHNNAATATWRGWYKLMLVNSASNVWTGAGVISDAAANVQVSFAGGDITLAGALNMVRLTTVSGADTFDAGSVNILYE